MQSPNKSKFDVDALKCVFLTQHQYPHLGRVGGHYWRRKQSKVQREDLLEVGEGSNAQQRKHQEGHWHWTSGCVLNSIAPNCQWLIRPRVYRRMCGQTRDTPWDPLYPHGRQYCCQKRKYSEYTLRERRREGQVEQTIPTADCSLECQGKQTSLEPLQVQPKRQKGQLETG